MRRFAKVVIWAALAVVMVVPGAGDTSASVTAEAQRGKAVPGLLQLAAHVPTHYDGRWFGRGSEDACGESWAMDVNVRGGQVKGRFWRGGVLYDLYGHINADGIMENGRAGKNAREFGVIAPRFLRFDVYFVGEEAEGTYAVSGSGGLYCLSPIDLKRTEE